jgi:glucosyl-dolichyl phosphate glucuronosyltransferase
MISIIVPTLNRASSLKLALGSFCGQSLSPELFEIIIVDNGSTDATNETTQAAIAEFPHLQIRYICEPEPGLLSGRHRGATAASGDILTFVDDDIEADPNWLRAIHTSFADPTVQIVGGRNLPNYEADPPAWLDWFWMEHPYGRMCPALSLLDFGEEARDIDANYIWGLNFSIRKHILIELGGFHPDCIAKRLQHFQGDGETGLTRKANALGYRAVYQPQALVLHSVSQDRMMYEYFDRRFFYQGVCDSYTRIRQEYQQLKPQGMLGKIKTPLRKIKQIGQKLLGQPAQPVEPVQPAEPIEPATEVECLKARFDREYQAGYQFHQHAVSQNARLLEWVVKQDYWDYKLPKLEVTHD